MLRDAYAFKEFFPRLRDFTVSFCKYDDFFGFQSSFFAVQGEDEEDMITRAVNWMISWLGTDKVLPPPWFRFRFDEHWRYESLRTQEGIWNKAYARLVREMASRVEEVEDTGKVWIEKQWGGGALCR